MRLITIIFLMALFSCKKETPKYIGEVKQACPVCEETELLLDFELYRDGQYLATCQKCAYQEFVTIK